MNFKSTGRISLSRPEDLHFRTSSAKNREAAEREERSARRESLALRGHISVMHRAIAEEMRQKTMEEERSLVASRAADREAVLEYQQSLKRRARESLAFRLQEWRRHREHAESARMAELEREHSYSEWRRLDWQEHELHKKRLLEENKAHLATLMDHWKFAKTNPPSIRVAEIAKGIEAELLHRDNLVRMESHLLTEELSTDFDAEETRRSLARHSIACSVAEESILTHEALETHQAHLQAVHREYLASIPKDLTSTPMSCRNCHDYSKGRVSLMLRLESWKLHTIEQEAEKKFVVESTDAVEIVSCDEDLQSADHISEY